MKGLSPGVLSMLCEQLGMLLRAGIGLEEGVHMLGETVDDLEHKALLEQLELSLHQGDSFVKACQNTEIFPAYYLHMIEIGGQSGRLEDVLTRLSHYYAKQQEMQQYTKRVLFYPLVLLGIMASVILVITTQVMPLFDTILQNLGMQMSQMAVGVMKIGSGVAWLSLVLLVAILVGFALLGIVVATKGKQEVTSSLLARTKAYQLLERSRFFLGTGMMVASGMEPSYAMIEASALMEQEEMKAEVVEKVEALQAQYASLTQIWEEISFFSSLDRRMLALGLKAGELEEVFYKLAKGYEDEAQVSFERILGAIEPAMIVILACIVGTILISVMFPLMGIMSSIG